MVQKSQKSRRKKKPSGSASPGARRKEHRFTTSSAYISPLVAIIGMVGCLVLGVGVWAQWGVDVPYPWASYLVASGGLGLGVAMWFGQPSESAVVVGDGGIAVEDGNDLIRVPWHAMRSLTVSGGSLVARSPGTTVRFSLGANPQAAAWALKEAAERVPDIVDVDATVTEKLPEPSTADGRLRDVVGDQVAGGRCANSGKAVGMEEDARLCGRCGQVYHKDSVPEQCVTCGAELVGKTFRA